MKYKLFELVVLARDVPGTKLKAGAVGTVVETYPQTGGLEVEFFDDDGQTIDVLTLDLKDVKALASAPSRSHP